MTDNRQIYLLAEDLETTCVSFFIKPFEADVMNKFEQVLAIQHFSECGGAGRRPPGLHNA